jgi:hypothetical protein
MSKAQRVSLALQALIYQGAVVFLLYARHKVLTEDPQVYFGVILMIGMTAVVAQAMVCCIMVSLLLNRPPKVAAPPLSEWAKEDLRRRKLPVHECPDCRADMQGRCWRAEHQQSVGRVWR